MVLVLGILQVALVVRTQLAVDLAAREGARAAAVSASPEPAAQRAVARVGVLEAPDVAVSVGSTTVTVTVTAVTRTDVPLIGAIMRDVTSSGSATMVLEPPEDP